MSIPITIAIGTMSALRIACFRHQEVYLHTPKYGTYKAIRFPISALVKPRQLSASKIHVDVVKPVCTAYTSKCNGTNGDAVSKP